MKLNKLNRRKSLTKGNFGKKSAGNKIWREPKNALEKIRTMPKDTGVAAE